jgi:CBS domain-containing protein
MFIAGVLVERSIRTAGLMKAADVMVTDVITVKPDNEVQDVAALMLAHHISAVPVVDEKGALVGIVSEGDLLRRDEASTGHERNWWLKGRVMSPPKRPVCD